MKFLSTLLFTAAVVSSVAAEKNAPKKRDLAVPEQRQLQVPVVMPVGPPTFGTAPVTVPVGVPVVTPVAPPIFGQVPGAGTPTTASSAKLAKKSYSSSYRGYRLYNSRRK